MSKYRFKTEEEFKKEGLWCTEYNCPIGWTSSGNMNKYLGKDVPKIFNGKCDEGEGIEVGAWLFNPNHYILKKPINTNGFKYFGDKVMEVSDDRKEWVKKVVFGKKNRYYLAWSGVETINESNEMSQVYRWKYARPVKTKITLQEIADKFGFNKDEIEIQDYNK